MFISTAIPRQVIVKGQFFVLVYASGGALLDRIYTGIPGIKYVYAYQKHAGISILVDSIDRNTMHGQPAGLEAKSPHTSTQLRIDMFKGIESTGRQQAFVMTGNGKGSGKKIHDEREPTAP